MDREKKKEKSGGFRRITGVAVPLMVSIALLTACADGSDKASDQTQSSQESSVADTGLTEEQEKVPDTNGTVVQQDGVAEGYEMMSVQAPTDQIISDYHEKGYVSVWLTSHEVNKEDGEIGEIGTTDTVNMQVTYTDPNGFYQITEEIGAVYAYWGSEMGWKNNYDAGTLVGYDITGFNGTRWKLVSDSDIDYEGYNYEMAASLIGNDTMSQYDIDSSTVSIYFALENFDIFTVEIEDANYFNKIRFYDDPFAKNEVGTVTVVVDGNVYSNPLNLKGASGDSYHSNLLVAEGASFYFDCAERYDECNVTYSVNGDSNMTFISAEEYEAALKGQVQKTSVADGEEKDSEIGDMREWLTAFGMDIANMTDEEIQNSYRGIQANLSEWGKSMDEMRQLVYNYSVTITAQEELDAMSDYEVYMEYGYLVDSGTFVTDAEEDM